MDLSLSNVISISVSEAGAGVGQYNTSNIALFTEEVPANSFGTNGFAIYKSPTQVGIDFGTSSKVYAMALAIFSQKPNILANQGYLVVVLMNPEVQAVAFSGTPVSGKFALNYGGNPTADINYNDDAAAIQIKLRAVTGLENVTVTGSIPAGLVITFKGVYGDIGLLTATGDTMVDSLSAAVNVTVSQTTAGETLGPAISRTKSIVQYFGVMADVVLGQTEMLAAAAVIQAENKLAFFVSRTEADIEVGGMLDLLRSGSFTQSRGLYYGGASDAVALNFMAAYAGRALSTNFNGSKTTQTMHLKDLATIDPDPTMTETFLSKAQAAGADCYISIQGVSKVFTSGKNGFFDDVYNEQWFVGALKVAGFNMLAQVGTKISQTEDGMDILKGAYRQVCEQAVANEYAAPGAWNSPTTFGNQDDLYKNISQRGYYIYSAPVSQQAPDVRATRAAPLVQIALKAAGAMHSSAVIVNINK